MGLILNDWLYFVHMEFDIIIIFLIKVRHISVRK